MEHYFPGFANAGRYPQIVATLGKTNSKPFMNKRFGNLTILIIPYLTICGGLYHIAYWDTFNLNGLSFISISDVIKSAASPILYVFVIVSVPFSFFLIVGDTQIKHIGTSRRSCLSSKITLQRRIINGVIFIAWFCLVCWIYSLNRSKLWVLWGALIALPIALFLITAGVFKDEIKNDILRSFTVLFFVTFLTLSYAIGKFDSSIILEGKRYKFTLMKINKPNSMQDTIKLIGSTDKYFVFSNLKNDSLILFSFGKTDSLVLYEKGK